MSSKFSAILAKRTPGGREEKSQADGPLPEVQEPSESPTIQIVENVKVQNGRGRPKAKRSNPSFQQVTAYIKRGTYGEVRTALFMRHDRKEFSELVEELLAKWLNEQKKTANSPS